MREARAQPQQPSAMTDVLAGETGTAAAAQGRAGEVSAQRRRRREKKSCILCVFARTKCMRPVRAHGGARRAQGAGTAGWRPYVGTTYRRPGLRTLIPCLEKPSCALGIFEIETGHLLEVTALNQDHPSAGARSAPQPRSAARRAARRPRSCHASVKNTVLAAEVPAGPVEPADCADVRPVSAKQKLTKQQKKFSTKPMLPL